MSTQAPPTLTAAERTRLEKIANRVRSKYPCRSEWVDDEQRGPGLVLTTAPDGARAVLWVSKDEEPEDPRINAAIYDEDGNWRKHVCWRFDYRGPWLAEDLVRDLVYCDCVH